MMVAMGTWFTHTYSSSLYLLMSGDIPRVFHKSADMHDILIKAVHKSADMHELLRGCSQIS